MPRHRNLNYIQSVVQKDLKTYNEEPPGPGILLSDDCAAPGEEGNTH